MWPFAVHAPAGEEQFLLPEKVRELWRYAAKGAVFPLGYGLLPRGTSAPVFDLIRTRRFTRSDCACASCRRRGTGRSRSRSSWNSRGSRSRFLRRPDAAAAGGKIHSAAANLEWDHYRAIGAIEAWRGIRRLKNPRGSTCRAGRHGPVERSPRRCLESLDRRLLDFIRAKGSICEGERDDFIAPETLACGAHRISPHLFRFGHNSYLLASESRETLVVDPYDGADMLEALLKETGLRGPGTMLVTHYHGDHSAGIPWYRKRFGAKAVLHPAIEEGLRRAIKLGAPYAPDPALKIHADELWPWRGTRRWNEYKFRVAHWPGQTWWHCAFMAAIDGRKVLFGGDSFQPATRWEGTGGFCAVNNSRFRDGFIPSARLAMAWRPDILANGHRTTFRYTDSRFRRIIRWARRAERAVRALCPAGDLERDYYIVRKR